jgi:hypothetical protein
MKSRGKDKSDWLPWGLITSALPYDGKEEVSNAQYLLYGVSVWVKYYIPMKKNS